MTAGRASPARFIRIAGRASIPPRCQSAIVHAAAVD